MLVGHQRSDICRSEIEQLGPAERGPKLNNISKTIFYNNKYKRRQT